MPYFKFHNIKITGVATSIPSHVVKTDDRTDVWGKEYIEKFKAAVGIEQIHTTAEHQTASDLCYDAAERLILHKNIKREEIGAVLFVGFSTDYWRPSNACILQYRLGLSQDCVAYDLRLACSATPYGLQAACSMMQTSDIKKVLLLIGEMSSQSTYQGDSTALLFGDAGSAILLEKTEEENFIEEMLCSDGSGFNAIIVPAGGFRNPDATHEVFTLANGSKNTLYNTWLNGADVFAFSISAVPKTTKAFFEKTGSKVDDYDCFPIHQANKAICLKIAKKLGIPLERMPLVIDKYGNTTATSLILALCDTYGKDNSNVELNCLIQAFGIGLSWGVASARINTNDILPITETDNIFTEGIVNTPADIGIV